MEHDSKIAGKIKSQITRFSHKISVDFKKPQRKLVVQMLYGIQANTILKAKRYPLSFLHRGVDIGHCNHVYGKSG